MDDYTLDPAFSTVSDALVSDASIQGPAWEPAVSPCDVSCAPAQPAAPTLAFPMPDGTMAQLPAEDSSGDGIADRVPLDFDQNGVADAWAYDQAGVGQVTMIEFDTTGDGVAD